MTHETVPINSILCTLGDTGDKLWVLMKGSVDLLDATGHISMSLTSTDEVTPAFGELSLMHDGRRNFTIIAATQLEVKVLNRSSLRECFAKHPGAENSMLSSVMLKYNGQFEEAVEMKQLHATDTVALIDLLSKEDDPDDPKLLSLKKMKHAARLELIQRTC